MNSCYQKSTLRAYTQASQTVIANEDITFANSQKTGVSIDFTSGNSTIVLRKPGLYQITFDAFGVESGTAGNIVVQLYNNGVEVAGATDSIASTSETDVGNVHFTTIVEIPISCCVINNIANLTIRNTGVGVVYGNTNVSVIKLA